MYAQNYHCKNALKASFKNTYSEVVIDFKLNLSVIFKLTYSCLKFTSLLSESVKMSDI